VRSREHLLFIGAPFKLPVHQARLVLCQPFLSELRCHIARGRGAPLKILLGLNVCAPMLMDVQPCGAGKCVL
jgi:hypothetical protein